MLLCVQPDGNCCQSLLVMVTWQAPGPSTLPHKVLARARPRVTTCAARICSCQAPGRGWLAAVLTQVPVPGVASRRELAGCYHYGRARERPAAASSRLQLHITQTFTFLLVKTEQLSRRLWAAERESGAVSCSTTPPAQPDHMGRPQPCTTLPRSGYGRDKWITQETLK